MRLVSPPSLPPSSFHPPHDTRLSYCNGVVLHNQYHALPRCFHLAILDVLVLQEVVYFSIQVRWAVVNYTAGLQIFFPSKNLQSHKFCKRNCLWVLKTLLVRKQPEKNQNTRKRKLQESLLRIKSGSSLYKINALPIRLPEQLGN